MFITGPDVIKTVTGEGKTRRRRAGEVRVRHTAASGEQDAFDYVRELLSYCRWRLPPTLDTKPQPRQGPIEENLTGRDLGVDTLIPVSLTSL